MFEVIFPSFEKGEIKIFFYLIWLRGKNLENTRKQNFFGKNCFCQLKYFVHNSDSASLQNKPVGLWIFF